MLRVLAKRFFSPPLSASLRRGLSYVGLYLALVLFAYVQFTYRRPAPQLPYLTGFDDIGYFVFARSLAFDGDLDFRNDYEAVIRILGQDLAGPSFAELLSRNPARPPNPYDIGTGLAAVPWLVVFRWLAYAASTVGLVDRLPSPYGPWYVFAYLCANLAYGVLGLALTHRLVSHHFVAPVATVATWSTAAAGPTLFYFLFQPGMAHLTALLTVAATLALACRWRETPPGATRRILAFATGLSIGFALAVRTANVGVLAFVGLGIVGWPRSHGNGARPLPDVAWEGLLALLGGIAGFAPQLCAWHALFGSWVANPKGFNFHWWPPHFFSVLFGRRHGLFFWHPWLLACAVGLAIYARRCPLLASLSLLALLATAWIYGSWPMYWLGAAFGARGFVDFLPCFALGAAQLIPWLEHRLGSMRAVAGIVAIFVLLNVHLLFCFRGGVITVDGPLFWGDTLRGGRAYFEQMAREWRILSTWQRGDQPGHRASLLENPPFPSAPAPTAPDSHPGNRQFFR